MKRKTMQKKNTVKWLIARVRKRIPALTLLTLCKIAASCFGVVFALATQKVIDNAAAGNHELFYQACVRMFLIIVAEVACDTYALHLQERLSADLDRDFKQDLMHKILRSDYSVISRYHSGDLLYRLNGDVSNVVASLLAIAASAISLVSGLIAAIIAMSGMDAAFTGAIFAVCLIIAAVTLLIQRYMKEIYKKVSSASGRISGFLQEIIEKLLIVQALNVTSEVEHRTDILLEERWQIQRSKKNVTLSMSLGASGLGYSGAFITLVWCAGKLLRGEITFGNLTAMTSLVTQMQGPLLALPTILPKVVTVLASAERLIEIDHILPQPGLLSKGEAISYRELKKITVKNLVFSYEEESGRHKTVIKGANCSIPKGGLTVITGSSGIGKSTLLKLLLGIYKPDKGELLMETQTRSVPISRATRDMFSYAPQGNLLLSGTIRDNILLSRPDADEKTLQEAVYVSAMEEYIARLPRGLDTVLGENGSGLSEGQVQRIALARAVITGAPILLLDEVTSSLDEETEKTVLERICALKDRTCIAVTHRPAALKLAQWELKVTEHDMRLFPVNF